MVIWANPPPVPRNILSQQLADQSWSDPTILTMLSRLVKKGFLSCEKQGNKNLYTPLVSREEYMVDESISFGEMLKMCQLQALCQPLSVHVESQKKKLHSWKK